ncbi:MAG: phenylacetate-CoA oxygenase [Bacteroidetes bacterium]|nr:phenylacetate-CoA oxygenase [Bacteroidota bacterium]
MSIELPSGLPRESVLKFILSLADDELMLGHRDSEWTGHSPILEEDIAFSNIAQDELGHSLVWYTLEQLTGRSPDAMAFERRWKDFICCRFVTYPIGDFAYSVVRQYLFDEVEQVRLSSFRESSLQQLSEIAGKLLREETYHLLHSKGLVERLGDATEESHRRMLAALDEAFPQALGMFESVDDEEVLVKAGVFPGNNALKSGWLKRVVPVLTTATLRVPVSSQNGSFTATVQPDEGGRKRNHTQHLKQLVDDLQQVYRLAPGAKW